MSQVDRTAQDDAVRQQLSSLKRALQRLWLISPERLWLLSISLQRSGRWRLAFAVKQLNTILYHNSLSPGATVSSDIALGHYSHGIVINGNVEIGRYVKIWQNVTLTAGRRARGDDGSGARSRIVIEQGVKIGANAVVIAPRGDLLRIGRGVRIGAGAVVTRDVPARATVVSPQARILLAGVATGETDGGAGVADVLSGDCDDAARDARAGHTPSDGPQARRPKDEPAPP